MALNVQSLPWADEFPRVQIGTRVRVPAFMLVCGIDVAALAGPLLFLGTSASLDWRAPALVVLALAFLAVHGHYRARISPNVTREAGGLLGCVALATLFVGAMPARSAAGTNPSTLIRGGLLAALLLLLGRALSYTAVRAVRARNALEPTLIIGAGHVGVEMAQTLLDHPEYGLLPVGFLDNFDDSGLPVPLLGTVRSLDTVLVEYDVRRVIIAFGSLREPEMVPVIRACDRASVDIHVLPRFFELGATAEGRESDDIWGMPIVRLPRPTLKPWAWRLKRVFDLIVGSAMLVLSAPVFAAIALMVRFSSPGSILFRQKRVGQHGRVVDVLKFRSMRENDHNHDTEWYVDDEERTTRIGSFIRRTSLDELPQLINVVRGDMSLVGPRPERPFFVDQFAIEVPRYGDRHRVPVGMTGWAQVHGLRGDTSISLRARFDNQYIETWSVWRDIVILGRTARAVAKAAVGPES
jgi:exopolysaccharide biosynthesis polyprenyl glycosylphosphotransferase